MVTVGNAADQLGPHHNGAVLHYLIRHAAAGDRDRSDDWLRPLTAKGEGQAIAVAAALANLAIGRVASSPAVRCVSTVTPLADLHGLGVEHEQRLFEGSDPGDALDCLIELGDGGVACTHGDVIPGILATVAAAGAVGDRPDRWANASIWVIQSALGPDHQLNFTTLTYMLPGGPGR